MASQIFNNDVSPFSTNPLPNRLTMVNWTLRNKISWNFDKNTETFFHWNAFENVACKLFAILFGLWRVNKTFGLRLDLNVSVLPFLITKLIINWAYGSAGSRRTKFPLPIAGFANKRCHSVLFSVKKNRYELKLLSYSISIYLIFTYGMEVSAWIWGSDTVTEAEM